MFASLLLLLLFACVGDPAYIVEGTVVEVRPPREVVVDHRDIPGLMGAMTMPFEVRDPALLDGLAPGDRIYARLLIGQEGSWLSRIRVTGKGPPPVVAPRGPEPLRPGRLLPRTELPLSDGGALVVGEGQDRPVVLTWLYTTCPIPEMCPATVARLQALQQQVGADAWLVAVTLDPANDTPEVLQAFAAGVGARPETWRFARVEGAALEALAMQSALGIWAEDGRIEHGLRWLVLDRDGRLVERYDDNRLPLERVVQQLRTGGPAAPLGSDGTVTPGL